MYIEVENEDREFEVKEQLEKSERILNLSTIS